MEFTKKKVGAYLEISFPNQHYQGIELALNQIAQQNVEPAGFTSDLTSKQGPVFVSLMRLTFYGGFILKYEV